MNIDVKTFSLADPSLRAPKRLCIHGVSRGDLQIQPEKHSFPLSTISTTCQQALFRPGNPLDLPPPHIYTMAMCLSVFYCSSILRKPDTFQFLAFEGFWLASYPDHIGASYPDHFSFPQCGLGMRPDCLIQYENEYLRRWPLAFWRIWHLVFDSCKYTTFHETKQNYNQTFIVNFLVVPYMVV